MLSGTAETLQMNLSCQITPQVDKQLLQLGKSQKNTKISAYAYLYLHYNYSALPFVPIGIEELSHTKSTQRRTFEENCKSHMY